MKLKTNGLLKYSKQFDNLKGKLTQYQIDVLYLYAIGLTSVEIGKELNITSRRTVEGTMAEVKKKLKARNTTHAVFIACIMSMKKEDFIVDNFNILEDIHLGKTQ